MFFVKYDENLTAKESRFDLATATMNGSVPFSLFLNANYFSCKG